MSSYECGMDQPTYTPVQQIVERSGTLFFSFQDLDSTKPAGSVKIRVETIAHYLERYAPAIVVALWRARESARPAASRLFEDPLAPVFLGRRFRWALGLSRVPIVGAI